MLKRTTLIALVLVARRHAYAHGAADGDPYAEARCYTD